MQCLADDKIAGRIILYLILLIPESPGYPNVPGVGEGREEDGEGRSGWCLNGGPRGWNLEEGRVMMMGDCGIIDLHSL